MSTKPERQATSIFVSYRIADTLAIADRLDAELQRTLGAEAVFLDRRTIEPGDTWDSDIETALKGAAVVLVLIGKKWLTEQNEHGRRRLHVPGDWVRREVETALLNARSVIPVLVDDASPPPTEAFAGVPSIAALSSRQGALQRTKDWDTDFSALVERLAATGPRVLTAAEAERAIIPGRIATRGQTPAQFDAFFSYNTREHAAVERIIGRALQERGLTVLLDRWGLLVPTACRERSVRRERGVSPSAPRRTPLVRRR